MATGDITLFQPIVCLTERADGRYDVDVDWGDSLIDWVETAQMPSPESEARAVRAADAWTPTLPKNFIIPSAEEDR